MNKILSKALREKADIMQRAAHIRLLENVLRGLSNDHPQRPKIERQLRDAQDEALAL